MVLEKSCFTLPPGCSSRKAKPFKIASLLISSPLALAPMAGITHPVFRELVSSFGGCGLYFSEMLSARRIPGESVDRWITLLDGALEKPLFVQIMGNEPGEMGRAVSILQKDSEEGRRRVDGIDINMGCSVFGIRKIGAGSGLMMNPDLARRVVASCRRSTSLPLTVKIRIGMRDDPEYMVRFARALQDEGVDAVTLHPRLIKERFKRAARWSFVRELKSSLSIPVIGNGDIESAFEVGKRFAETGCDGVMVGRFAVQAPWVFRVCEDGKEPGVDRGALFLRFTERLCNFYEPKEALLKLKIFTSYYSKNFLYGHHLYTRIRNSKSIEDAEKGAREFLRVNTSGENLKESEGAV